MARERPPHTLRRYVVGWAVAGSVAGVATLVFAPPAWPPTRDEGSWLLFVLLATSLLLHSGAITFRDTGGDEEAHALEELVLVASLVLLVPPWPWVVMVSSLLTIQIYQRRDRLSLLFNVAWYSVATAAAILCYAVLPSDDPFGPLGILAAAAGLLAYVTINLLAMAGIKHRLGIARDLRSAIFDGKLPVALVAAASVGALGVVAAFLLGAAPHLTLLLAIALWLVRQRSTAQNAAEEARREDHRRLERTVAGASDGIVLIDADGRIAVWNDAMARLTGIDAEHALGLVATSVLVLELIFEPPAGSDATHQLATPDGTRRLVAVERSPVELSADDQGSVVLVRDVTAEAHVAMLREDLISRVSHELRTPLTSITGLLETVTVRWPQLDDDARLRLLDRALAAGQRLTRLIDGLLARGRLDRGKGEPRPVVTRLDDVVDALVLELEVSLDLEVTRRRAPVDAMVDADHLAQILVALLENAVRYGVPPVEVATSADGDCARLVVRDHGEGVPDEFHDRLFEPFEQASTGIRRTARGLGLGLSIARELAEANGGQLRYASASDGGACFELVLPRA